MWQALKDYAKQNGMEFSAAVRQLLKRGLAAAKTEEIHPSAPPSLPRRKVFSRGV